MSEQSSKTAELLQQIHDLNGEKASLQKFLEDRRRQLDDVLQVLLRHPEVRKADVTRAFLRFAPRRQVASALAAQAKAALVDAAALQAAIASALTKFDAIEATFEARGQAGVATLSEQLVAEVTADKELSLPAEADKQARDMAVKEVAMAVKKYLGMQFGLWKKGKAEAVVVT